MAVVPKRKEQQQSIAYINAARYYPSSKTITERIAIIYLLAINIIAFVAYGIDKWKAKRGKWRISEMTLIVLAFIGGALGALLGMKVFRHETQHWIFQIYYCPLKL